MKKLIVANWKLNPLTLREARELTAAGCRTARRYGSRVETVLCPPAIFLSVLTARRAPGLSWGAQDSFYQFEGPHTGQISPRMLVYAGVRYVLLGHSERRAAGDTDEIVKQKVKAALASGLKVILCVGEAERDAAGRYLHFLRGQLETVLKNLPRPLWSKLLVAYEPIWAIGGRSRTADTPEGFLEQTLFIRRVIRGLAGRQTAFAVPILYGGSVTPQNAAGFLSLGQAAGLLVGHQSLRPDHFNQIVGQAAMV